MSAVAATAERPRLFDLDELPELVRLGRYELVYPIGRGTFGVVYEGLDRHLVRPVAVKVFVGVHSLEDIRAEAYNLARVRHPNVIGALDLCVERGVEFLVTELVIGGTLRQRARQSRDWREILGWFVQAARGLEAIHAEGLVHGDIKPSNILVDEAGRAQVIDFSSCRAVGDRVRGGTLRYMPPERFDGGSEVADPLGDQFSLAAAIHDILCVPKRPLAVPGQLRKVVARAMASKPNGRFASVTAFGDALERVHSQMYLLDPLWAWARRWRTRPSLATAARGPPVSPRVRTQTP